MGYLKKVEEMVIFILYSLLWESTILLLRINRSHEAIKVCLFYFFDIYDA